MSRWQLSARKRRNQRLLCRCFGWWFPHRVGSKASPETARRCGTYGCERVA